MSGTRVRTRERTKIVRLYGTGMSVAEVAAECQRDDDTVRRQLDRAGIPLRGTPPAVIDIPEAVRIYQQEHASVRDIAARYGVGYGTAHRALSDNTTLRSRRSASG